MNYLIILPPLLLWPVTVSLLARQEMSRWSLPLLSVWSHPHRLGTLSVHFLWTFISQAAIEGSKYNRYYISTWLLINFNILHLSDYLSTYVVLVAKVNKVRTSYIHYTNYTYLLIDLKTQYNSICWKEMECEWNLTSLYDCKV